MEPQVQETLQTFSHDWVMRLLLIPPHQTARNFNLLDAVDFVI